MDNAKFSRTIGLIGEENFSLIQDKKIYIAGLGGVGGTAFIALVRTGFKKFVILDKDRVAISNLNRQLLFTESDVGNYKVDVANNYALNIDKNIEVETYIEDAKNIMPIDVDFVVDCIDDIFAKVKLIKYCYDHEIPMISSMGMANKLDPSRIKVASLNKSTVDPLAKKMRYELKNIGVDTSKIMCAYSDETPIKDGNKLNSIITVTSTAGLLIANYVLYFLKRK